MAKSSNLTIHEQIFIKHLKKQLLFSSISIKQKVSIGKLYEDACKEFPHLVKVFDKDEKTVKDIQIDFVLYKGRRILAGIEIVDEPDELKQSIGKKLLINNFFRAINSECYRVTDLNKLQEASEEIKNRTTIILNAKSINKK